jgi:hypothetical protein
MKRFLTTPIIAAALFLLGAGVTLGTIYIGGSGQTGEINLQKGLVGHWKFDGNADDSTPYQNNGTIVGATLAADRKDQNNGAYNFNGSSYINIGSGENLELPDVLTIEAWVKPTNIAAINTIISKTGATMADTTYWMDIRSSNQLYFGGYTQAGGAAYVNKTFSFENNKWFHVVGVDDGASLELFVNGNSIGSGPRATRATGNWPVRVGVKGAADNFFNGTIDDIRVYNRALSVEEVKALYESYDPAPKISDLQKGLMAHWKFDGNAKDSTPYGNNGVLVGSPTPAEDRKAQANHAYDFNGTSDYVNIGNNKFQYQDNFTVSAYFQFPSLPDNAGICSARHPIIYNHDYGYNLFVGSTGRVSWNVYDTAGSSKAVSSASSVVGESFVHAVGIKSGTTISLYVNGAFVGQDTLANNSVYYYYMDHPFVIGGYAVCGGQRFYATGKIDDVRVYNRALNEDEIQTLYDSYDPVVQVSDNQKGLMAHWKFDGNAKDSTPYGNDGTVSGAALAADRKGQSDKAYSFNGESDYWIVDYGSGSKPEELKLEQFTVSAWVKANSFPSNNVYIATDREGCGRHNYLLSLGNGYPQIQFIEDESSPHQWRSAVASQQIATGNWYHLAGSYNGQNLIIYINGTEKGNTEIVSTPEDDNNSASFKVGYSNCIHSSITNYFEGFIDDVRVYSRALSEDEIQTLYEGY